MTEINRPQRGSLWLSRTGVKVQLINIMRHSDDCHTWFVHFTNLVHTNDFPPGEQWTIGLEVFLSKYTKLEDNL